MRSDLPFSPPPSFDINTNCNVKFRLEFSVSDAFDPRSIWGFAFTLKDPALHPTFQKTLTSGQVDRRQKVVAQEVISG
jgi:hypothetical protein